MKDSKAAHIIAVHTPGPGVGSDADTSLACPSLPALQRREKGVRLGTDSPDRRRERYPEPVGR